MEIHDIDIQMVRDALKDAPEFAKGHFENLLSQYETAAARVEELTESEKTLRQSHMTLEAKCEELQDEVDDLNAMDTRDAALEAVKYWMQDALVLHKPITDPRKILRMVEDALR